MSLLKLKMPGWNEPKLVRFTAHPTIEIGGRKYSISRYGNQWWMTENLAINIGTNYTPLNGEYGLLYEYNSTIPMLSSYIPVGWRVPSKSDFDTLISILGTTPADWFLPEFDGNNSTGFGLAKTGYISSIGEYKKANETAYIWSTTPYITNENYNFYAKENTVGANDSGKTTVTKLSIRLVKDAT